MRIRKKYSSVLLLFVFMFSLKAWTQPAFIPGDFADPSIIRAGKQYYAVGTSSEWAPHFPIYRSTDLQHWQQVGQVFDQAPDWISGSFWAPEYYYLNKRYYIYYTARRKKDGISCIGVASSAYPDRGFTDHGVVVDFEKEAIDAFLVKEGKDLYITFKAYGLDQRPIELLAQKLSADGLKTVGEPFSLLRDDPKIGMEGQAFLFHKGFYYLFYSAGGCCGARCSYNVRVARSASFKGPYTRYEGNPILEGDANWTCTGHGSFVQDPSGSTYYFHHAFSKKSGVFTGRQGMLAKLQWNETTGWPGLTEEPAPALPASAFINDDFNAAKPGNYWAWDFRHTAPRFRHEKGVLHLDGNTTDHNLAGIVLATRAVTGDFDVETKVLNRNSALKGLTCYGDATAATGIGIRDNQVQSWIVKGKELQVLASEALNNNEPVELKMQLIANTNKEIRFYYRQGNQDWKALPSQPLEDIGFLPQWDRSPRTGLHFNGTAGQDAQFDYFKITPLPETGTGN